jgi:hypothetical protein
LVRGRRRDRDKEYLAAMFTGVAALLQPQVVPVLHPPIEQVRLRESASVAFILRYLPQSVFFARPQRPNLQNRHEAA